MATKTFSEIGVLGLYTETSLHCGAEGGTGYVDLPIQRERHTQYPVIPGSTIKGVLRDELRAKLGEEGVKAVFGAEDAKSPGSVSFGDGILVAFPVRSSDAPFHWVTCPFVLERVFRTLAPTVKIPKVEPGQALGSAEEKDVLLEEIRVRRKPEPEFFGDGETTGLSHLLSLIPSAGGFEYTRKLLGERLLIVSDADFKELVETGTEVITRIKLNFLGTTQNLKREDHPKDEHGLPSDKDLEGNLFVEEVVPPETLFLAPLRDGGGGKKLSEGLNGCKVIRLGGDETIGRGVTHLTFVPLGAGKAD